MSNLSLGYAWKIHNVDPYKIFGWMKESKMSRSVLVFDPLVVSLCVHMRYLDSFTFWIVFKKLNTHLYTNGKVFSDQHFFSSYKILFLFVAMLFSQNLSRERPQRVFNNAAMPGTQPWDNSSTPSLAKKHTVQLERLEHNTKHMLRRGL